MTKNLTEHLTGAAKHHLDLAKCTKAASEQFGAMADMAKAAKGEHAVGPAAEACAGLQKQFSAMSDSHLAMGESCAQLAELFSTKKFADDSDLGKLMPSSVSGIAPPADGAPLHRAIARTGAPVIADAEKSTLEFSKVWGED